MADFATGEKVVYVGHTGEGLELLRIGQEVTIAKNLGEGVCIVHGKTIGYDVVEAKIPPPYADKTLGWCSFCFRRPINFKTLCNVKEKEPVNA